MGEADLEMRIRTICTALPGVTEKLSHGTPAFFAGRQFIMVWVHGHHDHGWPHLWAAAPPGAQEALLAATPDRYFYPPYVGTRGWIGLRLDQPTEDGELAELCEEAYRAVAPKKLLALLDESGRTADR